MFLSMTFLQNEEHKEGSCPYIVHTEPSYHSLLSQLHNLNTQLACEYLGVARHCLVWCNLKARGTLYDVSGGDHFIDHQL